MENNNLPLYECVISDDLTEGIEFISIVDTPAMESNFIALENHIPTPVKLFTVAKQILTGVVAIPNKQIYRKDSDGYEYNIKFTEKDIEKMRNTFMRGNKNANINLNHADSVSNLYIIEMWIVENPEMDKAKALGLNVPKGTLMASVKVDNDEFWRNEIESNKLRGFSLEGFFTQNLIKMQNQKLNMENQNNVVNEQVNEKGLIALIKDLFKSQSKQIIELSSKKQKVAKSQRFAFKGQVYEIFQDGEMRQLDTKSKEFKFVADGEYTSADGEIIKVVDGIAYEREDDQLESKVMYTKDGFEFYILPDGTVTSYSGRQIADGTYTMEDDTTIDVVDGKIKSADMTMSDVEDIEMANKTDMENQELKQELTALKKQLAENQTQFVAMQKQLTDIVKFNNELDEVVKSVTLAQTPNISSENAPNQTQYTPSQQKKKSWAGAFQNTQTTTN